MEKYYFEEGKISRRKYWIKLLIFGSITIIVITLASIGGIIVAQEYNERLIAGKNIINSNQVKDEITEQEILKEPEEKQKKLVLPVYSENAKKRLEKIYEADSEEKIAYLTFDDGPSANITPQILKVLEEERVKATFFLLGNRVDAYPELVKQEYEAGHYLANHSYTHDYNKVYSSTEGLLDEINRTEGAIQKAIGISEYHTFLFRFPGGSEGGKYAKLKKEAKKALDERNMAYINWNALTRDAEGKPTEESLVNDLKASAEGKNRIVVLMHDSSTKQMTANTLPQVIAYLREQGYTFKNFYDIMCE